MFLKHENLKRGVYAHVSVSAVCGVAMGIGVFWLTVGSTQSGRGRREDDRRGLPTAWGTSATHGFWFLVSSEIVNSLPNCCFPSS